MPQIDLKKHFNYLTESSATTMQSIFASILALPQPQRIKQKLEELQQFIVLNDIEKQIVKETMTHIEVGDVVNPQYIKNKFSYYFEAAPHIVVSPDQIDFAILDRKLKEERASLSKELLNLANNLDDLTPDDLKHKLRELTEDRILTADHTKEAKNSLGVRENAYENLIADNGIYSMLLPEVESHAGKAGVGHVISILAFVGSFKSTYALNLAYQNALEGHNVLYVSLESTAKAMESRMVLNHIAQTTTERKHLITQKDLREAKLTTSQIKYYNDKHNEMTGQLQHNLILWDSVDVKFHTFLDMTETLRMADQYFKTHTGKGLEIFVLDQLANLKHTDPTGVGKRYSYEGAKLDEWMTYFRKQSLNFLGDGRQITSFIVSQVRREAYAAASKAKNKGNYDASCGGDSNEIERTSDTMITLYKDLDTKNTILVHIPKARHGTIPDRPMQVEVYGDYYHVGPLTTLEGETITAESFEKSDFKLEDLLKKE